MNYLNKFICSVLILFCVHVVANERIVFNSFPDKNGNNVLDKKESAKNGVLIKKVNGTYVWASRENKALTYNRSGIFHIFSAIDGSGLICIVDSSLIETEKKNNKSKIKYGEHIRSGISMISYFGDGHFIEP